MNAIIIEDEHFSAEKLKVLLNKVSPKTNVLTVLDSVSSSIDWFKKNPSPDLIFLDIHLSDDNSFEIFNQIDVESPIIFTTAYDEFAIKAFKLNSIDYLLKPIDIDDLKQALSKLNKHKQIKTTDLTEILKPKTNLKNRFLVKVGSQLKSIKTEEIAYFTTANKLTYLYTFSGDSFVTEHTMDQLQSFVSQDDFFRINRQFLIRQDAIFKLNNHFNSRLIIELSPTPNFLQEELLVSRDKTNEFKNWLGA